MHAGEQMNEPRRAMKRTWSVVVVYEDDAAKKQAVRFCDELINRFWNDYNFELTWWSYWQLQEEDKAPEAANQALEAQILIFATVPENLIPPRVELWLEDLVQ